MASVFAFVSGLLWLYFLPLLSLAYLPPTRMSLSFPLTTHFLPSSAWGTRQRMLASGQGNGVLAAKYSMVLLVSLPVGTPPQAQTMLLDTGSQLSWVQCNSKLSPESGSTTSPAMTSFDPTVSTSFAPVSCKDPICKPRIPDFSIPTVCDQKQLCQYSYFYADGTLAEGNLVKEKIAVSTPMILGCSGRPKDDKGILGMNMGRLSFASQSKINKFSYCVPVRVSRSSPSPNGAFYLGENPNASGLKYVNLLKYSETQRMPNLDAFAYTVPMKGIRIGTATLNISESLFRPNAGGAGQTLIDSGSELTYLVDEAYEKVKETIGKLVGPMMKNGFSYAGCADMCFDASVAPLAAQRIGGIGLVFDGEVEISIGTDSVLTDVGSGVKCMAIGRSSMLGSAGNIIGNVHQQNQWVEYDLAAGRIGFGKADCSRSYSQR